MSTDDGWNLMKAFLVEGARVMGAIGVVMTTIWLLGKPVAVQFVNEAIDGKQLAPQAAVRSIEQRLDKVEGKAGNASDSLIALHGQVDTIEQLLTEQRSDIKALLRAIPNGKP